MCVQPSTVLLIVIPVFPSRSVRCSSLGQCNAYPWTWVTLPPCWITFSRFHVVQKRIEAVRSGGAWNGICGWLHATTPVRVWLGDGWWNVLVECQVSKKKKSVFVWWSQHPYSFVRSFVCSSAVTGSWVTCWAEVVVGSPFLWTGLGTTLLLWCCFALLRGLSVLSMQSACCSCYCAIRLGAPLASELFVSLAQSWENCFPWCLSRKEASFRLGTTWTACCLFGILKLVKDYSLPSTWESLLLIRFLCSFPLQVIRRTVCLAGTWRRSTAQQTQLNSFGRNRMEATSVAVVCNWFRTVSGNNSCQATVAGASMSPPSRWTP